MRNVIALICVCLAAVSVAQDQIFKKDNTKVDAKVLEVSQAEIKYKLFTYPDGPTIVISKSDVAMIIYQNGTHEVFNVAAETTTVQQEQVPMADERDYVHQERLRRREDMKASLKEKFDEVTATKQVVFLNAFDLMNGCLGFSYLREFLNHTMNVFVPLSIGYTEPWINNNFNITKPDYEAVNNFKYTRKTIDVGLGINFQTSNKRVVTHFIGPLVGMSQYTGTYDQDIITYNNSNYYGYNTSTLAHRSFIENNYYFMLNNGLLFRVTRNFNVMIYAAVGYQQWSYVSGDPAKYMTSNPNSTYAGNYFGSLPVNKIKLGFNFGYRF